MLITAQPFTNPTWYGTYPIRKEEKQSKLSTLEYSLGRLPQNNSGAIQETISHYQHAANAGVIQSQERGVDHDLAQAIHGDMDAFGEVVKYYENDVYNLTYRMLGNVGDAEDAAQEALLRAYKNLDRYDPSRKFKSWLLSIASNYCIDVLRKRRIRWVSFDNELLPAHPNLSSSDPLPEMAVLNNERDAHIQTLLDRLKDDERLIIILRYWYDMGYSDIAEMMEMTVSAVKSKLFRTRRVLAKMLSAEELSLN